MNKNDLARALQKTRGCSYMDAVTILNQVMDVFTEQLSNDNAINLQGFGSLKPWHQTSRPARNPKTGEPVILQPRTSVKFHPGKHLLEAMNRD